MGFVIEGQVLCKYVGNEEVVVVPKGIIEIADSAFASCRMKQIVLPAGLQKINNYAFYDTPELKQIDLPNTVGYIGRGAFGKSGIQRFSFPPRIKTVAGELFYHSALEEVVFGNNVRNINYRAFANCYHLRRVELPCSVVQIGEEAFYEAKRLSDVVIKNKNCEMGANAFGLCDCLSDKDGFIIMDGVLHKSPALFIEETLIIPSSVERIADHALDCDGDCRYYRDDGSDVTGFCKKIVLPDTIKESFSIHNSEVEEIVYNNKINIRTMDLLGCIRLKRIILPTGSSISAYAFGFWKENARAIQRVHIDYV